MYELDEKPLLKLRLDKGQSLAFGEGAGRKAKLRRIAQKCDHCMHFSDQACVSACPTGALLEVHPTDVVTTLPAEARANAKAGFEHTTAIQVKELNESVAFVEGLKVPELGRARAPRTRILIGLWWALGILAVLGGLAEITLRKLAPAWSAAFFVDTQLHGIAPEIALEHIDFRPGCALAVNFGYVGTALMISGLVYIFRRRIGALKRWGSLQAWFDWHVMTGTIGPAFIGLHSAAKLDTWVSLPFWSMWATFLSGILGRYLSTVLPERASTAAVELLEVERELAELRSRTPGVHAVSGWVEYYRRHVASWDRHLGGTGQGPAKDARKGKRPGFFTGFRTFLWVVRDDLAALGRRRALGRLLSSALPGSQNAALRKRARRIGERLALLERRRVLLPHLEPFFAHWKAVHIPMAVLLTVLSTVHIWIALGAGG
jgi:ferredoxin